jgi:RHS repeat-associated protein
MWQAKTFRFRPAWRADPNPAITLLAPGALPVRPARREASGAVYYYLGDHLGSSRVMTDNLGNIVQESDYYPFGGERVVAGGLSEKFKFAGMERDAESGLDHTLYRQYAWNLGRWLTPDPDGGDISNPQSLNRYGYVLNSPTNFTDPLGLDERAPAPELACDVNGTIFYGEMCRMLYNDAMERRKPPRPPPNPFTPKEYADCCKEVFGETSGKITGTEVNIPQYQAAVYVYNAAQEVNYSVAVIAATFLLENHSGNLRPQNYLNWDGTVDVGPMQLNASNLGEPGFPIEAYGNDLEAGHTFTGDIYQNFLAGARYLKSLEHPADYVGKSDSRFRRKRVKDLKTLVPKMQDLFDCLER